MNQTPAPNGPVVSSAHPMGVAPKKSKRKLWLIILIVIVVLLGLAGGYVFGFYLPNTPANMYNAALKNSGAALDTLVSYSRQQQTASYKSVSLTGTVHVKSPSASFDVNLSGAADKDANANLQLSADILGQKASANIRSVRSSADVSPDVYVQVSGIKSYLDSNGLNSLDGLDGRWIMIDHTLIDTYLSSLKQSVDSSTDSSAANAAKAPTYAQLQDALTKVQTVNKQYVFTTDASRAVLANETYLGKVTVGSRTQYHYRVGYSKAHLTAYVDALGSALDSSQLNGWSKTANDGKGLSEAMNLNQVKQDIQDAKSDYTFEVWVDTGTKLISKVAFVDPSDSSSTLTIAQTHVSGTSYPFTLTVNGKDDTSGKPATATFGASLDTKSHAIAATFSVSDQTSDGTESATGNFTLTPSNNAVQVTAPSGAESLNDLFSSLGLGGLPSGTDTLSPLSFTE
ncbi:MAG TPA: hypothetical protein VHC98_02790 [Candidatus Saccharimonadales bacterium]|nr:hypothetical protein [Candidatus Saccharimonadales bacterium]